MRAFLSNPNVQHFLRKGHIDFVANAIAVDYLRKMNVDERGPAFAWLVRTYPDVAREVQEHYPHHIA